MSPSESDNSYVVKVVSLRQSFRTSLAAASVTAVLLFFLLLGIARFLAL
ncbi:hypothetical protein MUP05_05170 [Candidatus Bathyarchaeota archaeon]|nr:hypothetical protein [Candidatus Bathyarchaeota archaeon]